MKKIALLTMLVILGSCIPELIPPQVEIVSPESGSTFSYGQAFQVRVDASDDDGTVDEVRLYIDDMGIASSNAFPLIFDVSTSDLSLGTHKIMVVATDDDRKESEATISISIESADPIVQTLAATFITDQSAIIGGLIEDDGGAREISAGVQWSPEPTMETSTELEANISGDRFEVTLEDLSYQAYYFRAWVENESGRSYGQIESFTTLLPDDYFLDIRDGNAYRWIRIGTDIWMAQNLAWLPELNNSSSSSSELANYYVYGYTGFTPEKAMQHPNYEVFGVLYNFPAAQEACPAGWHLPTIAEKDRLLSHIGGKEQAIKLIDNTPETWTNNASADNALGFSARGGGKVTANAQGIAWNILLRQQGGWWMADTCTSEIGKALPFIIEEGTSYTIEDQECAPFEHGYSVRCVKD